MVGNGVLISAPQPNKNLESIEHAKDLQISPMNGAVVKPDSALQGQTIFAIVCGGHLINHFQSAMLGVISISYLLAMSLLMLLRVPRKEKSLANI